MHKMQGLPFTKCKSHQDDSLPSICAQSRNCHAEFCLCRLGLAEGDLPAQFEAEERSQPGCGDLLQLVSGRTLLGRVIVQRSAFLQGIAPLHHDHEDDGHGVDKTASIKA